MGKWRKPDEILRDKEKYEKNIQEIYALKNRIKELKNENYKIYSPHFNDAYKVKTGKSSFYNMCNKTVRELNDDERREYLKIAKRRSRANEKSKL